jgi:hypothetical protein
MQANELSAVPVTRNGILVGMLTFDSIREFLRIRAALDAMSSRVQKEAAA